MRTKLFLLLLFIGSSSVAQNKFTLIGYGESFNDGDKIFLSYRSSNGYVDDSVSVKNKKFQFTGIVSSPVKASLYRNQNPKYANLIYDAATVYLEKGQITLRSIDTLRHSINSGTSLNRDYAELKAELQPYYEKMLTLPDPANLTTEEKKDTAMANQIRREYHSNRDLIVPKQFDFVTRHPSSYVSLITLKELVRDSRWLKQVENCFNNLTPELKSYQVGKEIANDIQLGKKISIGMAAIDFTQPDVNGQLIKLSDYKGKFVLLDFWASWCGPCRSENPNILSAFKKYKDKGFTVLSISIDQAKDRDKWLKAIEEDGLVWPQLSDLKGSDNVASKLYGITTIPANLLISPDGLVIAKDLKREALAEKLALIFK